jgi:hypothetical protein
MELLREIKQALEDSHFKMQELSLQTGPKYLKPQLKFLTFLDSQPVELFFFGQVNKTSCHSFTIFHPHF